MVIFVLGPVLAIPLDWARLHMLEHGRRLKGPQMVAVKEFNRWSGGNGIGFGTNTNARDPARVQLLAVRPCAVHAPSDGLESGQCLSLSLNELPSLEEIIEILQACY